MRHLVASLLIAALSATAAAQVRVATGGVGVEQRAALETHDAYNLKVVSALATGQYLADVHVRILDAAGVPVAEARTEGPWLMAALPPGRYRIVATYRGIAQTRDFTAGTGRQEIVLHWDAASAGDRAVMVR